MGSLELRWGLIIGAANLVWLYLSYYLGMHDRGLGSIQVMGLISVFISVLGYVFALRALMKKFPETQFLEGIRSGAMIAGVVAIFAALAQVGYFQIINPGWTDHMVALTRSFYLESGLSDNEASEYAEGARKTFGLTSYLVQAALGALIIGMISTTVIMAILRKGKSA
ncbi:MAG: DUF4199 domain-containing protein [Verrucomicrobiales bacterium]|nr:DUF4199 domain-containing protein [Verrucomicrobiales bacterium]